MFNSIFIKVGHAVINESAIVSVNLDYSEDTKDIQAMPARGVALVMLGRPGPIVTFDPAEVSALRRLFAGDPALWAQAEGPGFVGVLDLTAGEGAG